MNMMRLFREVQAMPGRADRAACQHNKLIKSPLRTDRPVRQALPVLSGSMTVEAAVVLPLFIFFMMNILFVLDMIRLQSNMTAALQQAGNRVCEYAFYTEYAEVGGRNAVSMIGSADSGAGHAVSAGLSETFVRGQVNAYLGNMRRHSCLDGPISYLGSDIMSSSEGDIVRIVASYRVRPFFRVMGVPDFQMQNRYYGHAWTGYDVEHAVQDTDDSDTTVYVTQYGTVFHRNRSCSYLNPSVSYMPGAVRETARNRSGGKYYRCPICKPTSFGSCLVTRDGDRYHSRASCPALKRTVRSMPLSEAAGHYAPCSKCGY